MRLEVVLKLYHLEIEACLHGLNAGLVKTTGGFSGKLVGVRYGKYLIFCQPVQRVLRWVL